MNYLVDTDWIIHALHGKEKEVTKLLELKKDGLAISVISLAELYEGVYRSADPISNETVLKDFLSGVMVLEINEEISKKFGELRAKLRTQGKLIGDFDLLIASTGLCYNLTLLTYNKNEFERVENLKIFSD
ncbi:VapC toxin family PIN domain ribonuclease [ANME-1 cluster archaeon AG-394-G21]|nr:VapC toxin family PIN domain ribonuclease [ANME-1 cluster archaeon AG-394-G21]